jgi:hypothetical protein
MIVFNQILGLKVTSIELTAPAAASKCGGN